MRERPILFSGPMVRAILESRKTQTRRVVAFPRRGAFVMVGSQDGSWSPFQSDDGESEICSDGCEHPMSCPYGVPGDRLWVRETHLVIGGKESKNPRVVYRASNDGDDAWLSPVWTPSIFMSRRFSRLLLEVKAVRVERLQEISEADAEAEGVRAQPILRADEPVTTHREQYGLLWDSINAQRGHSWESNPWVWVVEFERVQS